MDKLLRAFLLLIFLFVIGGTASATSVTVQAGSITGVFYPGMSATNPPNIRVYATKTFISNDSPPVTVPAGNPNSGPFYKTIACTWSSGVVSYGSFTLISTTDSPTAPDATYNFYLFLGNTPLQPNPLAFMSGIQVPATIASHTVCSPVGNCADFQDLYQASHGVPLPTIPTTTYNIPEIDAKIAAATSSGSGIHDPGSNGLLSRTALNATVARSFAVGLNLTLTNGDGVSGNPTISLGGAVPVSVTNDTNVTGSISGGVFTLGWTSLLPKSRIVASAVYNDQGNAFSTGAQDFGSATSLKVPTGAGAQPTANGLVAYDSTANRFGGGHNGSYAAFVTPGSTDVLTNKTFGDSTDVLGSPTVTLGSDATGDVYYRGSDGRLKRLGVGSAGQFIGNSGGIPAWATPAGSGSGTVTHTAGPLTANALVVGNGVDDIDVLASLGTTTTLLHGNASGRPSFSAVSLTADVSGILPGANGGTGSGFFAVAGPASSLKTFTFPNASATVLTDNAAVTVAQGGTGLTSGTSGGIPYFSGSTSIASSGALTANAFVIGGGAGVSPSVLALGTANQITGMNSGATANEYKSLAAGTSGTDFAIVHTANTVTFNIPDAGASARGLVTTGTQTYAGAKTFSTSIDAIIKNSTAASLPTAGSRGRLYFQTDGFQSLVVDSGTQWFNPIPELNPLAFGVKMDTKVSGASSCTNGSATLSDATVGFVSADAGKTIVAQGCGPAGANLVTTISSVTDSSHVVMAASASTTVSPANMYYGTDDTSAWNTAIAAIDTYGGILQAPNGKSIISGTGLIFGDGTTTTKSAKNNAKLRGAGGGRIQITLNGGASELLYASAAGTGPVVTVNGPYSNFEMSGFFIDGKTGSSAAGTVILLNQCHRCLLNDLSIVNQGSLAIDMATRPTGITGVNLGGDDNVLSRLWVGAPSTTTGGSLRMGAAATTSYPSSRNRVKDSWFYSGSNAAAIAVEVRYADSDTFENVTTKSTGSGIGMQFTATTDSVNFPTAIYCDNCAIVGNTNVSGSWSPPDNVVFKNYGRADGETLPTNAFLTGTDDRGNTFGTNTFRDNMTLQSSLAFTGTGKRITADFINATRTNRLLFQGSTANTETNVGVIPNGSGVIAGWRAYNSSDPDNAGFIEMFMNGTFNSAINIGHSGSGSTAAFTIFADRTTQLLALSPVGHITVGASTTGDFEFLNLGGNAALNSGANLQYINFQSQTELLTIAAAATTDTVFQVPANSVVLGVSVRVTTAIPTAATFTVTGASSGTTFNTAAVSTALNSTDAGTKAGAFYSSAAQSIRITPNLTPGSNAGRVRVTAHYYTVSPPTS